MITPAGDADTAVVLLGSIHPIGFLVVNIHPIELSRGLVVDGRPGDPAVVGDIGSTVIPLDHSLIIAGINPQIVIVPVRRHDHIEIPAAVGRFPEAQIIDVNNVWIG